MGSQFTIFSLYQLLVQGQHQYVLLRTKQPAYSNANYSEEEMAITTETKKREFLLQTYIDLYARDANVTFIGEMQDYPIGDALYAENGLFEVQVFYQNTEYDHPWIVLGHAETRSDYEKELQDDEDLLALKPAGPIHEVKAILVTENDF